MNFLVSLYDKKEHAYVPHAVIHNASIEDLYTQYDFIQSSDLVKIQVIGGNGCIGINFHDLNQSKNLVDTEEYNENEYFYIDLSDNVINETQAYSEYIKLLKCQFERVDNLIKVYPFKKKTQTLSALLSAGKITQEEYDNIFKEMFNV